MMQRSSESQQTYNCSVCGNVYATRGTLARHERNHRKDKKHFCEECNVAFRRRDLLTRHLQIHDGQTTTRRGRQRCHTACIRCRESRSKCDGTYPCAPCLQTGHDCAYRRSDGRLSEAEVGLPSPRSLTMHNDCIDSDGGNVASMGDEDTDQIVLRDEDLGTIPASADAQHSNMTGIAGTATHAGDNNYAGGCEYLQQFSQSSPNAPFDTSSDIFGSFSTSWQWTHEDLYLLGTEEPSDIDVLGAMSAAVDSGRSSAHDLIHEGTPYHPPALRTRACTRNEDEPFIQLSDSLSDLVHDMANYATTTTDCERSDRWHAFSLQLSHFVRTSDENGSIQNNQTPLLEDLVNQFFQFFHPLWPLILVHEEAKFHLHPILYLTLSSIGALYSGPKIAARYGALMHGKLRNILEHLPPRNDLKEKEALDIGRAMLLTQVAALYFEQESAFSAAQRLGAVLSAYAHRMRLFTTKTTPLRGQSTFQNAHKKEVALAEGRRMLAFGILRAETFMSILFNRKPSIGFEEMDLPLPFASSSTGTDYQESELNHFTIMPPCGGMLFSDLTRILEEEEEIMPMLRPTDAELLLFGLQNDIWRFCHDPTLFLRLIGKRRPTTVQDTMTETDRPCSTIRTTSEDRLDCTSRKMRRLVVEYERVFSALHKWRQALSRSQLSYPPDEHRSIYLSALILYELSFLRLFAPVDLVQQVAYQLHDPSSKNEMLLHEVRNWTFTEEAGYAIKHAREIWLLLKTETSRPLDKQAKYNILALIALHHAATVIWAIAGTSSYGNLNFMSTPEDTTADTRTFALQREKTHAVMLQFLELFPKITSAWGLQSSFSKMVKKLAHQSLPLVAT